MVSDISTIRAFAITKHGRPVAGVAIALAESDSKNAKTPQANVLAVRQTDHAGFVSFPYGVAPSKKTLTLFPLADPNSQYGFPDYRIPNVALVMVEDDVPVAPPHSFPGGSCGDPGDAEVSPSSLAANAGVLGKTECDLFLPGSQAERTYSYRQLALMPDLPVRLEYAAGDCFILKDAKDEASRKQLPTTPCYTRGVLLEYTTTWHALGHALGEIIYSLPLAPCESVRLAVVDWNRSDLASRTESTRQKEILDHEQHRDRVIEETVQSSLAESQRGFSVTGGLSYGGVISVGGGYSSSTGERNLHANNVQSVADSVQQASTSVRSLYSTVIMQSSQAESDSARTRVVRNHNHCHAMTVLYYEVLRRYLVRTEVSSERPLILIQFPVVDFDAKSALCHRWLLEPILLERQLAIAFDSLVRITYGEAPPDPSDFAIPPLPVKLIKELRVQTVTGSEGADQSDAYFVLFERDGSELIRRELDNEGDDREPGQLDDYSIPVPSRDFSPNDLSDVAIQFDEAGIGDDWGLDRVLVQYRGEGETAWTTLYDSASDTESDLPKTLRGSGWWRRPIPRPVPTGLTPEEEAAWRAVSDWSKDTVEAGRLLDHLNCNREYYWRRIWEGEDPGRRAIWLGEFEYKGSRLIDVIENRVVAVVGNSIAFPLIGDDDMVKLETSDPAHRLVDLPTRGLFAEAKLSNCNVCEEKDVTKFWDWSESPCPQEAPEIAPVSLGSRDRPTAASPSPFAAPIVNIATPTAVPDPTGLGTALGLLGQSNLFRDMSMSGEVAELVSGLAQGSVSLEQARARARQIQQGGQSSSGTATSRASSPMTPSHAHDAIQVTRNAMESGDIARGEGREIISDILSNQLPEGAAAKADGATTASVEPMVAVDKDYTGRYVRVSETEMGYLLVNQAGSCLYLLAVDYTRNVTKTEAYVWRIGDISSEVFRGRRNGNIATVMFSGRPEAMRCALNWQDGGDQLNYVRVDSRSTIQDEALVPRRADWREWVVASEHYPLHYIQLRQLRGLAKYIIASTRAFVDVAGTTTVESSIYPQNIDTRIANDLQIIATEQRTLAYRVLRFILLVPLIRERGNGEQLSAWEWLIRMRRAHPEIAFPNIDEVLDAVPNAPELGGGSDFEYDFTLNVSGADVSLLWRGAFMIGTITISPKDGSWQETYACGFIMAGLGSTDVTTDIEASGTIRANQEWKRHHFVGPIRVVHMRAGAGVSSAPIEFGVEGAALHITFFGNGALVPAYGEAGTFEPSFDVNLDPDEPELERSAGIAIGPGEVTKNNIRPPDYVSPDWSSARQVVAYQDWPAFKVLFRTDVDFLSTVEVQPTDLDPEPQDLSQLQRFLVFAAAHRAAFVEPTNVTMITGFASPAHLAPDPEVREGYNQDLSQRRADYVKSLFERIYRDRYDNEPTVQATAAGAGQEPALESGQAPRSNAQEWRSAEITVIPAKMRVLLD